MLFSKYWGNANPRTMFSTGCRLWKGSDKMSYNRASNNVLEGEGDSNTVSSGWTLFCYLDSFLLYLGEKYPWCIWWCVWEKNWTNSCLGVKSISWFLQCGFLYYQAKSIFGFLRDARCLSSRSPVWWACIALSCVHSAVSFVDGFSL